MKKDYVTAKEFNRLKVRVSIMLWVMLGVVISALIYLNV